MKYMQPETGAIYQLFDKGKDKKSKARSMARYECKRQLLCRGKIYCGHCGHMLVGCQGNTKAYTCPTDKKHNLQIALAPADWLIWEVTSNIINIAASINTSSKTIEIKQMIDVKKVLMDQLNDTILTLESKKDKLLDIYIDNKISKEQFEKRINAVDEDIAIQNKEIQKLSNELNELEAILNNSNMFNVIDTSTIGDFETKQEFVRRYIDKMTIIRTGYRLYKITFSYNLPIILPESVYIYDTKHIYRLNEDGTEDLIWSK